MEYNLEIDKIISSIKKNKAKNVLIQLADGLRPKAKEIQEKILSECDVNLVFWIGSCFGACDTPYVKGFDLLVQVGHSEWE